MEGVTLYVLLIGCATVLLIVGLLLFVASLLFVKIIRKEGTPELPVKLSYKIPQSFESYCEKRDGWKRYLPWLAQLTIFSLFVAVIGSLPHLPNFGSFLISFFGCGLMLFVMMAFSRSHDQSITFYHAGIGNLPKGGKTPYDFYEKAIVQDIQFEDRKFRVVNFIPKRATWMTIPAEYGFSADDDIAPLLALLKEQGLAVEER